jgi:glycosyltransferase involved in cell wall biosynthesis
LAGRKTVIKMTQMGTDDPLTSRERRGGAFILKALAKADGVVAITEELAQSYLQAGLSPERLVRIPNGVDTAYFCPLDSSGRRKLRNALGLPLDVPVVLFVGIVHPRKGVDRLLDAWPQVQSRYPDATLVLVGPLRAESAPPDFVQKLNTFAENYRIRLAGQQTEVHRFYQAADIFALPSRMEGLPNALLEAMACGLPVISSTLTGMTEIIEHNVNGVIVSPNVENALSEAILGLLGDRSSAQRLGQAAQEYVLASCSLDVVADRYIKLYNTMACGV